MFTQFSRIQSQLESNKTELEVRKIIQQPIDFKPNKITNIKYYSNSIYPNVIFREYSGERLIKTKETVMKQKMKNNINLVLSVEDEYIKRDIKGQLEYLYTRKIQRESKTINGLIIDITECEGEYQLEIEFNSTNIDLVQKELKKYKYKYWPQEKPREVTSKELARVLVNAEDWIITPKADGEHVIIYENLKQQIMIVHDNGSIDNIFPSSEIAFVYEGELMADSSILYYDCFEYNNNKLLRLNYKERYNRIPETKNKKEIFDFKMKTIDLSLFDYPTDGYILKHNLTNKTYKSKGKPTVDFKFLNNQLLLEYETYSEREYSGVKLLQNNKIYEFDLNLNFIKERPDKTKANNKIPTEANVLENVIHGYGIPTLRNFHNNIKHDLLSRLKNKRLLDIGSGKGGDLEKWRQYKFAQVFAVDPHLDLYDERFNFVVSVKDKAQNVYKSINYNCVSILFVPWDPEFLKIMKGKECILAVLQNPRFFKNNVFSCEINNNEVSLIIPNTNTAQNIKETYHDLSFLKKYEIKYTMTGGVREEKILQKMYKYYYIPKYL